MASEKRWPYFTVAAPAGGLDDDALGMLAQAAADGGALGTELDGAGALRVYLPAEADAAAVNEAVEAVAGVCALLGLPAPADDGRSLPDEAWATAWKDHFKSFALGERFVVRPNWEQDTPEAPEFAGRQPIFLLPGQAFGTGTHETTRVALKLVEQHVRAGDRVLDFGTGSGILSIAAAQLGASEVYGIEHDPDALPNARENLGLNGVGGQVKMLLADVPEAAPGPFNLIICNILPQYALAHMPALAAALASRDSVLIYSGYLADEIDGIEAALRAARLSPVMKLQEGHGANAWGGLAARLT